MPQKHKLKGGLRVRATINPDFDVRPKDICPQADIVKSDDCPGAAILLAFQGSGGNGSGRTFPIRV